MRRDPRELLPPPVRIGATVGFVLAITLPIAFMLLLSVTPDPEIGTGSLIPSHWAFDNYARMWSTVNLGRGLANSLVICGISSTVAVVFAVGAAYVLSRFDFRGRFPYLYSLIALQSVPHVMLLLPLFVLFSSIQTAIPFRLIGTYQGPVITYLTFALPLATWLMVSYLSSIPVELEEAALVDGAAPTQIFRHILVPQLGPVIALLTVLRFIMTFNKFDDVYLLTGGGAGTEVVSVRVYEYLTARFDIGAASAQALVLAAGLVVLLVIYLKFLAPRVEGEED